MRTLFIFNNSVTVIVSSSIFLIFSQALILGPRLWYGLVNAAWKRKLVGRWLFLFFTAKILLVDSSWYIQDQASRYILFEYTLVKSVIQINLLGGVWGRKRNKIIERFPKWQYRNPLAVTVRNRGCKCFWDVKRSRNIVGGFSLSFVWCPNFFNQVHDCCLRIVVILDKGNYSKVSRITVYESSDYDIWE